MTSQRTNYDDERLTEQESIEEGKSEPKYRFNEKTRRILIQNERSNVKTTPMDDKYFEWLRSL